MLYWIISAIVTAPGRDLAAKFGRIGVLEGKTKDEITSVAGPPVAISAAPGRNTILQWMATGYHIVLLFDENGVCKGVRHESRAGLTGAIAGLGGPPLRSRVGSAGAISELTSSAGATYAPEIALVSPKEVTEEDRKFMKQCSGCGAWSPLASEVCKSCNGRQFGGYKGPDRVEDRSEAQRTVEPARVVKKETDAMLGMKGRDAAAQSRELAGVKTENVSLQQHITKLTEELNQSEQRLRALETKWSERQRAAERLREALAQQGFKFCTYCARRLSPDAKFCDACGKIQT